MHNGLCDGNQIMNGKYSDTYVTKWYKSLYLMWECAFSINTIQNSVQWAMWLKSIFEREV